MLESIIATIICFDGREVHCREQLFFGQSLAENFPMCPFPANLEP